LNGKYVGGFLPMLAVHMWRFLFAVFTSEQLIGGFDKAPNSLICADVPLTNYLLTHSLGFDAPL